MKIAWALALRDMRGGLKGLRLLIICLFLGVAGLAGVGSLARSITAELDTRGQEILGGDVELQVAQRQAADDEREAFARLGTVSESIRLRAMASRPDATASVLAELKSIDDRWPLYGALSLAPGALAQRPVGLDAAIAPALAERLSLKPGDPVRVGETTLRVIGLIAEEPDRVGEGFTLGPSILVSQEALAATRLAFDGGSRDDVVATLESRDGAALAAVDFAGARRWFTSFGSCSIDEPLADLRRLGLVS